MTKEVHMGGGRFLVAGLLATIAAASSITSGDSSPEVDGFTFHGEPIHPRLVEEFESWISDDRPPATVTVDVAAAFGTNEYSEAVETNTAGLVWCSSGDGWYGYQPVGRLSDGTYVLRTASNFGGSGIFMHLLFVRLDAGEARHPEGARYTRILMSVTGGLVLGDRDDGEVRVDGDRVVVGASRYRTSPTVLALGR